MDSVAASLFEKSNDIEQKRLLLKFMFKELKMKDGVIGYELNFPFSEIEKMNDNGGEGKNHTNSPEGAENNGFEENISQNSKNDKMPIHGSDGIHVGLTEDGKNLAIYYSESKVYKNRTTAINKCLESIRPLLIEGKDELELELLNDNFDLTEENKELERALIDYFDYNHYKNKEFTEIRGICLIGFNEEECYSCLSRKEIAKNIAAQIEEWVKGFKMQVKINTLEKVFMHAIFIPFHSVDDFRKAFKKVIKYEDK